jgi:L-ascorbate metabolism protein UlaG (beta-lactamase superfamily)
MKTKLIIALLTLPLVTMMAQLHSDTYSTPIGQLAVTQLNHSSIMLKINGKVIYIDPYERTTNFSDLPKADLILITHEHPDHFDKKTLDKITTNNTNIIATSTIVSSGLAQTTAIKNGETKLWNNIEISAVPAYNILHKRPDGKFYHEKGIGNGYILSFKTFRLYIAGDTENIPEMATFGKIDIAFLPKNLPYTMTDEQFIDAAKMVHPKVLYPYHYSELDREGISKQLPKEIEFK